MRLWAYGTSPHGLSLPASDFGTLSPREFYSLQDVQQAEARRWAISMALTCNMNLGRDEVPFIAEDFLGSGNREKRKADRDKSRREAAKINRHLEQTIKKGVTADALNLPEWAKRGDQCLTNQSAV